MPAKKEKQTTNASLKKYAAPRNKTGKGGFGDRPQDVNRSGQRNKAAVQTAAQYRDFLVEVLQKPFNSAPPDEPTYLEWMAYKHVAAAAGGDGSAREQLLDRIWGKSNQPIDLSNSDGSLRPTSYQFVPYVSDDRED